MFKRNTPIEQMNINNYDEFLAAICTCITSNGIDANRRRQIIQSVVNKNGGRFPSYISKADAGNFVITAQTNHLSPNTLANSEDEQPLIYTYLDNDKISSRLSDLNVVQTVRWSADGRQKMGRGLLGGMSANPNVPAARDDAGFAAAAPKLELFSGPQVKGSFVDDFKNAAISGIKNQTQLNAYSVHDIGFIVNNFMPTPSYLANLRAKNLIDEETVELNETITNNNPGLKHMQKDAASLKLAVSNSYTLPLNKNQTQRLERECLMDPSKKSQPLNFVVYQLEARPILLCLFPQDYLYRHEFYAGILKTVHDTVTLSAEDEPVFAETLRLATTNIINRMIQDIRKGTFPAQVNGIEEPGSIFRAWKSMVEINFSEFVRSYAGLNWETLTSLYDLDQAGLHALDSQLQGLWTARAREIEMAIEEVKNQQQQREISAGFTFNETLGMYYNEQSGDVMEGPAAVNSKVEYIPNMIYGIPLLPIITQNISNTNAPTNNNNSASSSSTVNAPASSAQALQSMMELDDCVEKLISCPIMMVPSTDMVIGSDCCLYSQDAYYSCRESGGELYTSEGRAMPAFISAFTREPFFTTPFVYADLRRFTELVTESADPHEAFQNQNVLEALLNLSRDPLTGNIMTNPRIAIVEALRNGQPSGIYKVMVADVSTLRNLQDKQPPAYIIRNQKDFGELQDLITLKKEDLAELARTKPNEEHRDEFILTSEYATKKFLNGQTLYRTNPRASGASQTPYRTPTANPYSYGQSRQRAPASSSSSSSSFSSSYAAPRITPLGTETRGGQR